jgi:mRNA-degrading endonuclease HigB of HigAB toxin-antitoxin module
MWRKTQIVNLLFTFGYQLLKGQIGGNKYRLICKYYFGKQRVHLFVKWIGTHAEYTKLCKENNQFNVDSFK